MQSRTRTLQSQSCLLPSHQSLTLRPRPQRLSTVQQTSSHWIRITSSWRNTRSPQNSQTLRTSKTIQLNQSRHWDLHRRTTCVPIPLSSITVLVKTGSRQENLSNSSVANFVAHGALNGTAKYSKDKID